MGDKRTKVTFSGGCFSVVQHIVCSLQTLTQTHHPQELLRGQREIGLGHPVCCVCTTPPQLHQPLPSSSNGRLIRPRAFSSSVLRMRRVWANQSTFHSLSLFLARPFAHPHSTPKPPHRESTGSTTSCTAQQQTRGVEKHGSYLCVHQCLYICTYLV